mmetsp:Transcript_25906/g.55088  ORF Transcript_25906/g.55088 Transcript_25906/m.55088 type:complete len:274 (+) Transcript_25906:1313-2134(+)
MLSTSRPNCSARRRTVSLICPFAFSRSRAELSVRVRNWVLSPSRSRATCSSTRRELSSTLRMLSVVCAFTSRRSLAALEHCLLNFSLTSRNSVFMRSISVPNCTANLLTSSDEDPLMSSMSFATQSFSLPRSVSSCSACSTTPLRRSPAPRRTICICAVLAKLPPLSKRLTWDEPRRILGSKADRRLETTVSMVLESSMTFCRSEPLSWLKVSHVDFPASSILITDFRVKSATLLPSVSNLSYFWAKSPDMLSSRLSNSFTIFKVTSSAAFPF